MLTPEIRQGLERVVIPDSDYDPLDGLEVGVAGLSLALSAVGCLTAASCRSHPTEHSWSDYPVVLFAAPPWRVEILAQMLAPERCGLGAGRDMLSIYAASVRHMHNLAERILAERARLRRRPEHLKPRRTPRRRWGQMQLGDD